MHLSHLFQRTVRMHGERPALAEGTGTPQTYAALDRRVRALARWLREARRLHPGDRVVLALSNAVAYAEAMLAIWHAELCAVPLNATLHPDEVGHVIDDAGARLCLSRGAQALALAATVDARPAVDLVDVDTPGHRATPADRRPGHLEARLHCRRVQGLDQALAQCCEWSRRAFPRVPKGLARRRAHRLPVLGSASVGTSGRVAKRAGTPMHVVKSFSMW